MPKRTQVVGAVAVAAVIVAIGWTQLPRMQSDSQEPTVGSSGGSAAEATSYRIPTTVFESLPESDKALVRSAVASGERVGMYQYPDGRSVLVSVGEKRIHPDPAADRDYIEGRTAVPDPAADTLYWQQQETTP